MTDVRLTATNPEDSSVVPVACNTRGELLVQEVTIESIPNDVTIDGVVTVPQAEWDGEGTAPSVSIGGVAAISQTFAGTTTNSIEFNWGGTIKGFPSQDDEDKRQATVNQNNYAFRASNEAGGLAWGVDWTGSTTASGVVLQLEADNPDNYVDQKKGDESVPVYVGPTLNVGEELAFLRAQVRTVMEKLKMTPEGGWPVWDGSDDDQLKIGTTTDID